MLPELLGSEPAPYPYPNPNKPIKETNDSEKEEKKEQRGPMPSFLPPSISSGF